MYGDDIMRILILTNKMPYPPKDGGSIASLSLALSLQECDNEISVLSMNTNKHYVELDTIPNDISSRIKFYAVPINTDIKILDAFSNFVFSKTPYNAARFISENYKRKLVEILNQEEFDVIQLEGLYLCPYIDIIRANTKAKIALRSHNIEHEIWQRAAINESNTIKKSYKKNLAQRIKRFKLQYLNKFDYLVPITARDGDRYQVLGNTKPVYVAPTGIDAQNYIIDNSETVFPGIFHIGALDWIPNQEGLYWFIDNVWDKFSKKHPNIKFYLAGRNAPNNFENYIKQHNIEYLGEIEDANSFINKNSIMIVPLLSGSGMRIKIIEGMALGKVIITTAIGTEGIGTTHNENILIADDSELFLKHLETIVENIELRDKISRNAISFISKNFNNVNIAKKLTEFYKTNKN